MSTVSKDFLAFQESFFGPRGYGWEPVVSSLLRLEGEEREHAETLLIEALKKGDSEAAYGLQKLRSTRAVPELHEALEEKDAKLRISSALALWHIERFPKAAAIIIRCVGAKVPSDPVDDEEIDDDLLTYEQVDAVCALGEIATHESATALVAALSSPSFLVRANAATALGRLCGQSRQIAALQTGLVSSIESEVEAARKAMLACIDLSVVGDDGPQDFEISFDPMAHEYLVYAEGAKNYYFHPDYAFDPIVVPTGNYLTGILGKPRSFAPGERERIVPRLEKFLARERTAFNLTEAIHRAEPTELTPAMGGKVRFKTYESLQESTEELPYSRRGIVILVVTGVILGGAAGTAIGRFLELLFDLRPPTAILAGILGVALGGGIACCAHEDDFLDRLSGVANARAKFHQVFMMTKTLALAGFAAVAFTACQSRVTSTVPLTVQPTANNTNKAIQVRAAAGELGRIERLDPALDNLLSKTTFMEKLAEGFDWSEGPVWMGDHLLFSDVPMNTIFRWDRRSGVTVAIQPSGYTGAVPRAGEPGSNGLTRDKQGRLIACQHGDRRVARWNGGRWETIADRFEGKRFNSPNDVVQKSNGDFYFTDPPYGLPGNMKDATKEIPFQGVYRVSASDGKVTLLTDEVTRPNGLAFSPDEKTLYVASSDPKGAIWMAYPVKADGTLDKGRVLLDATSMVGKLKGLPDGLKVDREGNLWATGPGGVLIISPSGKHLGTLLTGEATANCAWGDDGSVLYITADTYLCRIRTRTKGAGW